MNTNSSVVLHLDSRFRSRFLENDINGYPLTTNFIYNLTEAIEIPLNEDCEISLYTTTIPYSFYNVRDEVNNAILIQYYDDSGAFELNKIELSEGNYSAVGLKNEFQTQISKSDVGTYPIISGLIFTITYSRETLKYNFILTSPLNEVGAVLKFNFYNTNELFGFRESNTPYILEEVSGVRSLKSEICIDINDSIHGLYVRTNLSSKSTLDNENGVFTNILARIPINTNAGGIIFHTPTNTKHKSRVSLHSIQSVGVKITDDRNRTIDLNGLHFQISFLIDFIPKKTKTHSTDKYKLTYPVLNKSKKKKTKKNKNIK